jgi:four helix bundle protein
MRRASVSISSNIAEGSLRASRTDFARSVEIATGWLFEVVSQTTVALRRKTIAQNDYDGIYARAEKQSEMLSGLRRSLSKTLNPLPRSLNAFADPTALRQPNQFGHGLHFHFLHHVRAMYLHGLLDSAEIAGDLFVQSPGDDVF